MRLSRSFRLACFGIVTAATTIVCSSGYITPGSLSETEAAEQAISASATALYGLLAPTGGDVQIVTATPAPPTEAEQQLPTVSSTPTPAESPTAGAPFVYIAQSGDTLAALSLRFGVPIDQIVSPQDIPEGLITEGQIFTIPNLIGVTSSNEWLLPDTEVVYSPTAIDFNTASFVGPFDGYLATYSEYVSRRWRRGPAVVDLVAKQNSINPRVLLSLLQVQSNWVLGQPTNNLDYPMGYENPLEKGLYLQLTWTANQLLTGYYGWRDGTLTHLTFPDGQTLRLAPDLNAGTVAVQYLFSQLYTYDQWSELMDPDTGFAFTHNKGMFPDTWVKAEQQGPLFPPNLTQPKLSLPFARGQAWAFTSGPHGAWAPLGSLAALDFAPGAVQGGCADSANRVVAAASGVVARVDTGVVVVDLDGDGNEETGWVILYLHLTNKDHIHVGDWVNQGDFLGNPSCEGGSSTGTHVHIARKYNGEWMGAGGPVPFNLSGWVAHYGDAPYQGTLTRGDQTLTACTCSDAGTRISVSADDPY